MSKLYAFFIEKLVNTLFGYNLFYFCAALCYFDYFKYMKIAFRYWGPKENRNINVTRFKKIVLLLCRNSFQTFTTITKNLNLW